MSELTGRQVRHWYATWLAEVLENEVSDRSWDHGLHTAPGPTPASVGGRLGLIDYRMARACRDVRCRQFAEYRARRAAEAAAAAAMSGEGVRGE